MGPSGPCLDTLQHFVPKPPPLPSAPLHGKVLLLSKDSNGLPKPEIVCMELPAFRRAGTVLSELSRTNELSLTTMTVPSRTETTES